MTARHADRAAAVSTVLEAVTSLSRAVRAQRRTPFAGKTLTRAQVETLFHLTHSRRAVTPGALASVLGVTAGAVTQLVDSLRSDELVETAPHPDDARSRVIRLTATASAEIAAFERDAVRRLLPRFDDLDDDELTALADLLARTTEGP